MADAKNDETTVFTGTVKSDGDERTVRLVEAPVAPKRYPFGWGVVAFAPALFAPARRPLFFYDLLLVGLPTVQSRILAYLMRRQVAERIMGSWRIPMPSWAQVAWELGTEAKAARKAFRALERIRVVKEVSTQPRLVLISPFIHYVGAMDQLRSNWRAWFASWTPESAAWNEFWATAPERAQITRIAKQAQDAGTTEGMDEFTGFPKEWSAGLDDGPLIDHSLDPELMPKRRDPNGKK